MGAKHLIPATNSQYPPAAPVMGAQVYIPTLRPDIAKVGAGGFAARNDHKGRVGGNRLPRADHDNLNTGFRFQRVQIIEIGDARQLQAGDLGAAAGRGGDIKGILGRQPPSLGKIGQNTKTLPAGTGFD